MTTRITLTKLECGQVLTAEMHGAHLYPALIAVDGSEHYLLWNQARGVFEESFLPESTSVSDKAWIGFVWGHLDEALSSQYHNHNLTKTTEGIAIGR